jgi:hypothetical protein
MSCVLLANKSLEGAAIDVCRRRAKISRPALMTELNSPDSPLVEEEIISLSRRSASTDITHYSLNHRKSRYAPRTQAHRHQHNRPA